MTRPSRRPPIQSPTLRAVCPGPPLLQPPGIDEGFRADLSCTSSRISWRWYLSAGYLSKTLGPRAAPADGLAGTSHLFRRSQRECEVAFRHEEAHSDTPASSLTANSMFEDCETSFYHKSKSGASGTCIPRQDKVASTQIEIESQKISECVLPHRVLGIMYRRGEQHKLDLTCLYSPSGLTPDLKRSTGPAMSMFGLREKNEDAPRPGP